MGPDLDADSPGSANVANSAATANRKLTQPLRGVVAALLLFTGGLIVLGLLQVASGDSGVTISGFGRGTSCADLPLNGVSLSDSSTPSEFLSHIRPGASADYGTQVEMCANHPTAGQRVLVTLTQAPSSVFYLAVLALLYRLLRTVGTAGPFAPRVAWRLRFLGWFVLAGSLTVTAVRSVAQSFFGSTVVADPIPVVSNAVNAEVSGFVVPLLIACRLLTLARVIRAGAEMSDDLAGTV